MKLLDEKQRLFGIVNPIDAIIVIAVIVAVIAAADILFGVNPKTIRVGHGNRTVEMVVKASAVAFFDPADITAGDKVIRIGGANVMGTVKSFQAEPAIDENPDAAGKLVVARSTVTTDVYITVDGTGDITSDGAFIGDEQVRVNMPFDLAMPRWQAEKCRVVSLKVVQ